MTMTRTAEMITRPRLQHSHRSPTPQGGSRSIDTTVSPLGRVSPSVSEPKTNTDSAA
jgi:hypothetical protein